MFIDQICQKKEAHWLRPDISEYTINNKHYVKFIEYLVRTHALHFIASPRTPARPTHRVPPIFSNSIRLDRLAITNDPKSGTMLQSSR